MIHVAIDMDGVLADLVSALNRYTGHPDIDNDKPAFFRALPEFSMNAGFQSLPKMSNADNLVKMLKTQEDQGRISLSILTSAGQFYNPTSEVIIQKKRWLDKNFPVLKDVPFTATTCGADKAKFAHPFMMLIDDYDKNIKAFNKAGGIGYLYKNLDSDITEIKFQIFRENGVS